MDNLAEKSDVTLLLELSRDLARAYVDEWIRVNQKVPSSESLDETERRVGLWVLLEKKRLEVVKAIFDEERKIIDSRRIKPAPAIDMSSLFS